MAALPLADRLYEEHDAADDARALLVRAEGAAAHGQTQIAEALVTVADGYTRLAAVLQDRYRNGGA